MKVTISERLKEIMLREGLRQVDILARCRPYCEKSGVEIRKGDLSQYVSGKVKPNSFRLSILAAALDVSERYLLGYDEALNDMSDYIAKFQALSSEDKAEVMAIINYKLKN